MTGFLGVEQEFESSDGLSRGDAGRLIEVDPSVDIDPGRSLLPLLARAAAIGPGLSVFASVAGHSSSSPPASFRSRATAGDLRSSSIRARASKLVSRAKRRSGANLRLTRRA